MRWWELAPWPLETVTRAQWALLSQRSVVEEMRNLPLLTQGR
jgi:hypothetical protein